jgi:glycosyltransferase involved in cell wall biosynthesis
MKLCLLADAGSIHTRRWAEYFADQRHEVHLFSMRPARYTGVTVHELRLPFGRGGYFAAALLARPRIRALAPDLVHAHYASSYGLCAALCGQRPLVMSVWGSDVYDFPRRGALQRRLLQWNLRRADLLCATSAALARETARYTPPGAAIHLTPFGVDTNLFQPRPGGSRAPGVVLGTARILERTYGLDVLLEALARLDPPGAERAGQPLTLWIAGDGPDRERLRRQTSRLNVERHVQFLGAIPHERMPALLWGLDLFVNPSRAESFGVAALEAAASGLPVVASRVGGLPEIVVDGETGLLVPPEDPAALAEALAALIRDPERRRALGSAAREYAVARYDWRACARVMEQLYEGVLARQASPPDPVHEQAAP